MAEANNRKRVMEDILRNQSLNSSDSSGQYSLTAFPTISSSGKKTSRPVRMVGIEIFPSRVIHSKDEEGDPTIPMKVPPRSLIPPTLGEYPPEWQVNLSSGDIIRENRFPEEGEIRLIIQRNVFSGRFSMKESDDDMEGMVIRAPILQEDSGLPHEIFTHVKMILDKATQHLLRIYLIHEGPSQNDHSKRSLEIASESLSRVSISPPIKRKKNVDAVDMEAS